MNNISLVYLNGDFMAPDQAKISAFDRGFIFGDGVYEVIPVFSGKLFRLTHHLQRLQNNLTAIGIDKQLSVQEWGAIFQRLIKHNSETQDHSIYLQITRGVAQRDHSFPADAKPTVFAYAQNMHYPDSAAMAKGVSAITVTDNRWLRCDIKAIALLPNVILRQQAVRSGASEAILIRNGSVTEGAASNIFIVKNNTLLTSPKGPYLLPGITRDLIVELANSNNIACEEREIDESELHQADEVWMSSSTKEIMPITHIDNKVIANGKPGPMHATMYALYQDYKRAFLAGEVE